MTIKPRTPREQLVAEAIETWVNELVDLGGQNRLLYYRPLKVGTLDLGDADTSALDRLLTGGRVRVTELYRDVNARQDALKRCRAIAAKARENDEERGIKTLYLAFGMATWRKDRPDEPEPNTPVLLQPLTLTRIGAAAQDYELLLDDEPELNPTLLHFLSIKYQVSVDANDLLDPPPVSKSEREACTNRLLECCSNVPDVSIKHSIGVGNFSYAKLPMVRDIQEHAYEIENDTLLAAIAGDADARGKLREVQIDVDFDNLTSAPPPSDEFIFLDADSSQSWAVAAAAAGATLVIEGPPGTGKSQTIANLIVTLAAKRKSVLFVAEKRAAIDAVVHRLNDNDLGHLVLDLHGGASDRRRIAKDIQAALQQAAYTLAPDVQNVHRTLNQSRDELDDYRSRLHERSPWGPSAFECQERSLNPEAPDIGIHFDGASLRRLTSETMWNAREDLRRFVGLGGFDVLKERSEPYSVVFQAGGLSRGNALEAIEAIDYAHQVVPSAVAVLEAATQSLGLDWPLTVTAANELAGLLKDVEQLEARCGSGIWSADLDKLAADLRPARKWWRPLASWSSSYKEARATIRTLASDCNLPYVDALGIVEEAQDIAARWGRMARSPSHPRSWEEASILQDALRDASAALERLRAALGVDIGGSFDEVQAFVAKLAGRRSALIQFPEMHRLHSSLTELGLDSVIDKARAMRLDGEQAATALERAWHASVLDRISADWPYLAGFNAYAHERVVRDFAIADKEHIKLAPARVRRAWASHSVSARDNYPDESQMLSGEANRQRRLMPIRNLYSAAAHVLTAVKPCWVMSPLVVAQVLPARKCFDVVVFDEASQIPPADAIPALLRGRQAIVAGDPHQLPPTKFFASDTPDDGDSAVEDEEEDEESQDAASREAVVVGRQAALVGDVESLLDQMQALLPPPYGTRTLSWHYRSRCERLITFSNAHIYDWRLTTFPSAVEGACVQHVLAPFVPGVEEASSSAGNEVKEVVRLILEHAAERPTESLGVIALGISHANRIEEERRQQLLMRRDLDEFFKEGGQEPFFVKNLERVQGDERDAIILTTGYSKTKDGRMRYNFGSINQRRGYRRLNVAVTRAKKRMTVVSSFTAGDMDDGKLNSEGTKRLKDYLLYAESGGSNLGVRTRPNYDMNPFERDVYEALMGAGVPLKPQFGQSGYWIDFAAMHRERSGEAVLAIETDGARYHSSQSARDADRLRQENLERLGWRFHRIRSTEWSNDKEGAITRAVRAYEDAIAYSDQAAAAPSAPVGNAAPFLTNPGRIVPTRQAPPTIRRGEPITYYSQAQLREVVRWVKSDDRLYTENELMQEVMVFLGFGRRGARIVEAITAAIRAEGRRR